MPARTVQLVSYFPGTPCTVNKSGDMYMIFEARDFFDEPCVVIKQTKAGLVQVALQSNTKQTFSFPQRNIDLL